MQASACPAGNAATAENQIVGSNVHGLLPWVSHRIDQVSEILLAYVACYRAASITLADLNSFTHNM
jgi:hypothetical protein